MKTAKADLGHWHVGVAAEAAAAALFARCGCDVSVQYGANQPGYDLIVAQGPRLIKVSVKGSQTGEWPLVQKEEGHDRMEAIEGWDESLRGHGRLVFCFVQFSRVPVDAMPRVYLASLEEVAACLRLNSGGAHNGVLHEQHTWKKGQRAGTSDGLPADWKFSAKRVEAMLASKAGC